MLFGGEGELLSSGGDCIFNCILVFPSQSDRRLKAFFGLKVLADFSDASACVRWQAQWQSLGRQPQEMSEMVSPLCCTVRVICFPQRSKGNRKSILPTQNL